MTLRPDLGSFAEDIYNRLYPFHTRSLDGAELTDEDLNWSLLIYLGTIAGQWQELEDLMRDGDHPGYSALLDINRIKDAGLPWLSQFLGIVLPPGLTPAEIRAEIEGPTGFKRGSVSAVAYAAQRRLTGEKNVIINERVGDDPNILGIVTFLDETPNPALTEQDIEDQLPWEISLQYTVEDGWTYSGLRTAFDDYAAIRLHYNATGYQGVRENNPPA